VVSVIDETDGVVAEKRLPNDLAKILAKILSFLAPWRAGMAGVVLESTFNWYWLVDGLQTAGYVVHLANTTAIKKNTMGSNIATTRPTRATWPTC
jgi:hypothetical protein